MKREHFKKLNSTIFFFIIASLLLFKFISYVVYPYVGGDGVWSMSQVFSYYNGLENSSVFAHEFLGPIFTVHVVNYCLSLWFQLFGVTTFSFLTLEFSIIILTLLLWAFCAYKLRNFRNLFYFLILGYAVSNYTYAFRPENFCILIISFAIFIQLLNFNKNFKLFLVATLVVFCGLIHHIGGLFFLILMCYYFFSKEKNYVDFLKFCVFGMVMSLLLTKGEIFNYLLLPTKYKSEMGNHLSGFQINLFFKYLIYSGPMLLLVLYLYRKVFNKVDFIFILLLVGLLCFFGRSYYMPYLYTLMVFLAVLNYKANIHSNVDRSVTSTVLTTFTIFYSVLILFFTPIFFIFCTPSTNYTWKKVANKIQEEKIDWNLNKKYFVPTELAVDVYDHKQARLIYGYMKSNDGIQDVSEKVFYVTNKEQLKWITKNFNTSHKKSKVAVLVKETKGHIVVSSLYKLKIKRQNNIGLWKVEFVD